MTTGKDVAGAMPSDPSQTDDPLLALLLSAPEDDEDLDAETLDALREAEADLDAGRVLTSSELAHNLHQTRRTGFEND